MAKKRWSINVVLRYTLLQVPAVLILVAALILARKWFEIPPWFFWGMIVVWVVKDIVMFPFVWRAYDCDRGLDMNSMVHAIGRVKERLAPGGYVEVRGELWKAEAMEGDSPIEKGAIVRILDSHGLTLIVAPYVEERS